MCEMAGCVEAHRGDSDQPEQIQRSDDRVRLVHEGEDADGVEILAVWALYVSVCSIWVWSPRTGLGSLLGRAHLRQRIKKVVKYCMNPKRIKTHTRPAAPVFFLNHEVLMPLDQA